MSRPSEDDAPDQTPEAVLLQRYTDGDDSALEELVAAYQEPAFWVARHVVGNDDSATDLVQDAFLRLLTRQQQYDPCRPFKAWFLQIVRNLAIDSLRRRKAHLTPVAVDSASAEDAPRLERRELAANIQRVLALMPAKQRELILLREVEGYGADEIASIQSADYSTTRWRIHQARKTFRKLWLEHIGDEDLR